MLKTINVIYGLFTEIMSDTRKINKTTETKSEREILELRIDVKLNEAKEALRLANQTDLERIGQEKNEPKYKRLLSISAIAIAILIAGNLWQLFGINDRIKTEAGRIVDEKLIDPQLKSTLDEALSKKAVPFIAAQVQPIETNVAALVKNVEEQKSRFAAMSLDVSNNQIQLASPPFLSS
jgi:hypothetical protein